MYLFVKNLQGDVTAITTDNGTVVVKYTYDEWGNTISVKNAEGTDATDSAWARYIPFRYRGYVFDSDTGLYYLQSRYYDPQTGRFLNADVYCDTNSGSPLSTNMFAYCENSPVMFIDPTGYWVASIGLEAQAAAVIGGYLAIMVNFDSKGQCSITISVGLAIITNASASISGVIAYYFNRDSVDSLNGMGLSVGASFSVGVHFGASGSFETAPNGGTGVVSVSFGGGASMAPVPYFQVRFGYTHTICKFNYKSMIKDTTKKVSNSGVSFKITKKNKFLKIYSKAIRKSIKIYNNGKLK